MRNWIVGTALAAMLLPTTVFAAEQSAPVADVAPASDVEIVKATFGIFDIGTDGQITFVPTTTVPLVEGQNYGWSMLLRTSKKTVHWREEFKLPGAAPWGVDGSNVAVSADKTTSVTEKDESLDQAPVIFNAWAVAKGDPAGHYAIRVTVDNRLTQTFEFDVR